jgi:GntR family transcriptional regulator / MocR family aminotransferase
MYTAIIKLIEAGLPPEGKGQRGVYLQVYEAIKQAIEKGKLPKNTVMPPTREVALHIGLSRSTIVKAYSLLVENQLLKSKNGSSYTVAAAAPLPKVKPVELALYPGISQVGHSFIQSIGLLNKNTTEGVGFAPGLPPLDIFPIGQWQKLTNAYWRNIRSSDLNYSTASGSEALKLEIANYLLIRRNIKCHPDQVMIVAGSLQSLYLIGNVLIDKGDVVCMENPTFPNVISVFTSLRAEIKSIDTDDDGMIVSQLDSEELQKVKIFHVTPSNQYPLGGKMSLTRRLQLLDWASSKKALIIENDYEHEINNWSNPVESIFSLDQEQRTIYLGTFNRVMHPSIRLGYMILPTYLVPVVRALQMHSHRFVPLSLQAVMTDFMRQNQLYKHIRNVVEVAAERKQQFVAQFQNQFHDSIQIRPTITPSFHLVAQLQDHVDDERLVAQLEAAGILSHPLSKCYIAEPRKKGLILGYSAVNRAFMSQFLSKMAHLYNAPS